MTVVEQRGSAAAGVDMTVVEQRGSTAAGVDMTVVEQRGSTAQLNSTQQRTTDAGV